MVDKNHAQILTNIDVTIRNLKWLKEKLEKHKEDQFAPNVSEYRRINGEVKSMKQKSASALNML